MRRVPDMATPGLCNHSVSSEHDPGLAEPVTGTCARQPVIQSQGRHSVPLSLGVLRPGHSPLDNQLVSTCFIYSPWACEHVSCPFLGGR